MTGVESLERNQGGYKYLYYELKYMQYNILENILENILKPFSCRTFEKFLECEQIMYKDTQHDYALGCVGYNITLDYNTRG